MTQPTLPTATLADLTSSVRDMTLATHGVLAGQCEGAAGLLAETLFQMGHDAHLVWGEYDHPCPEGYPTTGHCWVRIGDAIADPTRGQFDDGPAVCAIDGSDAVRYRMHHAILHSQIG